jgi:hypothetical protein
LVRVQSSEVDGAGGVEQMVSERYLGTAEDIAVAVGGATVEPDRTRHLAFGAVAAVWGVLARLSRASAVMVTVIVAGWRSRS